MRIQGTICEADSGRPIQHLVVRAFQRDLLFDEPLGFATTGPDGSFEISSRQEAGTAQERRAQLFLRVLDASAEHEIYDTLDSPRPYTGADQAFEIAIPAENLSPRFERRDRSAATPQEFIQALSALTPRIFATPALVALNVAVFAALVLAGASPLAPTPNTLLEWGANFGARTLSGEWWRLLTCVFLHAGILHLSVNCYVLWVAGKVVERLLGSASFLALYLACGVIASLTSLAWNPFAVSVGASGAIFGVWGALLGYAMRQRDRTTLKGLLRLRNIALLFVVANVLFGMTQEQIDQAAHLGGLIAGIGGGLILSQPISLSARARRGPRLAILCVAALAVAAIFAVSLPRRVVAIQAELERFDRVQLALTLKLKAALAGEGRGNTLDDVRAMLEDEILPEWNEARTRIEGLRDLPGPLQLQVEGAIQNAREREAEWHTLAGDFGRFQDALKELQELEDRATDSYTQAFAEHQAGALSRDDFVDVLYREVLSEWESERKIDSAENLHEPLQSLIGGLRLYAETRTEAWRLYVEAVRIEDAALARAASEQHLKADSMIARWAGVPMNPDAPAAAGESGGEQP